VITGTGSRVLVEGEEAAMPAALPAAATANRAPAVAAQSETVAILLRVHPLVPGWARLSGARAGPSCHPRSDRRCQPGMPAIRIGGDEE